MQLSRSTNLINLLEATLVFCLGFGLFISKPVIYIASTALVLVFLTKVLSQADYRRAVRGNQWVTAGILLYLLGLVATLIYPGYWLDVSFYARKSLFLLLFGAMLIACQRQDTRISGLIGVLLGFWLAAMLTIYEMPWDGDGHRLRSASWPVDIWGVLCGLLAAFLIPSILSDRYSKLTRSVFAATALAAVIFMLLSGSRGPTLAIGAAVFLYLMLAHRRILLVALLVGLLMYWPTKTIWPDHINQIESRIASIGQTTTDESNWIRLHLWRLSIAQDQQKWADDPWVFLFGSGPENHIHEIRAFFNTTTTLTPEEKERLESFDYPSNDVHNMYLDSVAKMGVVWTIGVTLYLIGLMISAWRKRKRTANLSASATLVIATFLIIGIFYDAMLHFNAIFMAYFASLALSARQPDQT